MKFSIVKRYKIFFAITITFLLIGIGSMLFKGFNLGIDFTGGSIMDLEFGKPVTVAEVRDVLKEHDLGNAIIQLESSDSAAQSSKGVLIRTGVVSDEQRQEVMSDLKSKIGEFNIQRVENVGATVGGELIQQAVMAIVLSWFLMIAYITVRFEFRFALAAIIALIIDVMVTLSYFSLFHMELDSSFVAALLTVVGYSVNGTIVIFDRIRENLKIHRRSESMTEMVDNSIWQTMGRSVYTVGTSLFAVVAIFLWGGDTIRNFSFAMLVGFSSGAYTSTLLAGPLWMLLRKLTPGKD
jgi:preprotein translocase subunit SecF